MRSVGTTVVNPYRAQDGVGFAWKWLYNDELRSSAHVFTDSHERAEDAGKHACDIEIDTSAVQPAVDGGLLTRPGSPHA